MSEWIPSPNFWAGRPEGPPNTIVIHTMAGSILACDTWFANPQSQVSAHYGVSLEGDYHGYVHTNDRAWSNGYLEPGNCWGESWPSNPNHWTIAIETEDLGSASQEVTETQYSTVRTLCRMLIARHGCEWLAGHNMLAPSSRRDCPGSRWYDSGRMAQLAADTGLRLLC